jgi:sterol 3beta-glucosyltransferase
VQGFIGAIKGAGRSCKWFPCLFLSSIHIQPVINVNMRPAAGALGLVVHPTQGAWKSMQKMWAKEQEQYQHRTRLSDGVAEVQRSTTLDQEAIMEKFKTVKLTTDVRQKKYKDVGEKEMYRDRGQDSTETDRDRTYTKTSRMSTLSEPSDTGVQNALPDQTMEDEDPAFERDLELAKQLSIAEQRENERGSASTAAFP